ncbi:MAG: hypothetical protein WCH58_04220 [Candidatus Saccharibacteria bacterium]
MKTIILKSLKELVADRYLLVLLSVLILLALSFAVTIGLSIHPSYTQQISHYSAFGITNYYIDQWYYIFVFVAFGIVAAILHVIISIKLLVVKGHPLAVMFAWIGIGVIIIGWITALTLLNLRTTL